jgi:hypothetical protein
MPNGSMLPAGSGLRVAVRPEELRHVEAGGEILADRADDADPQRLLTIQQRQRVRQLLHHRRAEGILLRRLSMTIFRM